MREDPGQRVFAWGAALLFTALTIRNGWQFAYGWALIGLLFATYFWARVLYLIQKQGDADGRQ